MLVNGPDYPDWADQEIIRFAMIETAQALDQLDAILSVEGLDAIYIGPSDLSLSLGCRPSFDDVAPRVAEAIQHILDRARFYGLAAGIHTGSPEGALRRVASGFQLVTIGSDANFIATGARAVLAAMRSTSSGP
jgi:4-hydroxy-2-oxoheptanedioate aldolase